MARTLRACVAPIALALMLVLSASPVLADGPWGTPQSIEDHDSYSQMPQVVMDGSDVVAVWLENTNRADGTYSIQSNRSTDGGETWEGKTLVSSSSLDRCDTPQVAMSGSNVVAIWYEVQSGTGSMQSSCSTDKGETWSPPVRIDNAPVSSARQPDIAIDGNNVVATWKQSDGTGNIIIATNRSSDGGATWEGSQSIDFDYGEVDQHSAEYPKVVVQGQNVVVGWKTRVSDSVTHDHYVYANSSVDGGETWNGAQLLSSKTDSYSPELTMSGSTVIAIWNDNDTDIGTAMYYNRSTDSGATWDGPARLDNGVAGGKYVPSIDASGSNVVAVWRQFNGSVSVVWSNCSSDGGASWDGAQQIDPSLTVAVEDPRVAMSDSTTVAVWYHDDGTAQRAYSSFSTDGGESWSDPQRIQGDVAIRAGWPRVAMDGTRAVAVWQQHDDMNSIVDIHSNYFERPAGVDIELTSGWNMVSVPVTAADMSTSAVFGTADAVYWWNPATKSYTIPATIDPKKGYWVAVSGDQTITVTGEPVETWEDNLSTGWNMIGSVSGDAVAVGDMDDVPADTIQDGALYTWNPTGKCYSVATQVEQGKAYWAACDDACVLSVGASPA